MIKLSKSNEGFVLIAGLMLLVVLTVIGAFATRSAVIELQIAGNEREYTQDFLIADGVWQLGAVWLEEKINAPDSANPTGNNDNRLIRRNFGDEADGVLNEDFSGNTDGNTLGKPYFYRVTYIEDKKVAGGGENFRDFTYTLESNANRRANVTTRVTKVYKVGY